MMFTHIRLRYLEPKNTLYANEGHQITSEETSCSKQQRLLK